MSRKSPSESPESPPEAAMNSHTHVFDLARRGYDRDQVDDHMRTLLANLAATHKAHQHEHDRANRAEERGNRADADARQAQSDARTAESETRNLEAQLRQVSTQLEQATQRAEQATQRAEQATQQAAQSERAAAENQQQSFGYRVERLIRSAEQEAAEVRASAAREATAMLEQAREQAEAHRHEVEHSIIARHATMEQDAARRGVALDERERQITEQGAAAQTEAERILGEARKQADQLRDDARTRAELERIKVEKAIRARQESAEHELVRLHTMHDDVRGELGRILTSLAGEFENGGGRSYVDSRDSTATGRTTTLTSAVQPPASAPGASDAQQPRPRPYPQAASSSGASSVVEPITQAVQIPRESRENNGGTYDHELAQRS